MNAAASGEIAALVRAALRENRRGLTTEGVCAVTGLERRRARDALLSAESVGDVEQRGAGLALRWALVRSSRAARVEVRAAPAIALVANQLVSPLPSVFAVAAPVAPVQYSPGASRVMAPHEAGVDVFVQPEDFTPGAFMADWTRRRGGADEAAR